MKPTVSSFDAIAGITKKEEISNISSGRAFGILILESQSFPGYYAIGDFPAEKTSLTEKSVYLILEKQHLCLNDCLLRKIQKVRDRTGEDVSMCPGELQIYGKKYPCIRVAETDETSLSGIITNLTAQDIRFHRYDRIRPQKTLIYIRKFIHLLTIGDGIYEDEKSGFIHFLQIPDEIRWDEFETMTAEVKNNCLHPMFDAALASLILNQCRFMDCIRIYTQNGSVHTLQEIRHHYLKQFETPEMLQQLK